MADVEQRAEAEAAKKGLSGGARKSYIGGVFNRIRQAHDRATTPSARGRKLFNRRERVQARLDARLAMQPHREAIDVLRRQRNERIAAHQDEPRETDDGVSRLNLIQVNKNGTTKLDPRFPVAKQLTEKELQALQDRQDRQAGGKTAPIDEISLVTKPYYFYNALFPDKEKRRTWYRTQSTKALRDTAEFGGMSPAGTRSQLLDRLVQGDERRSQKPAAPAKPPKLPAPERQRQRAIADAIKHGAPDFPPGTLAAAQGKPAPTGVRLSVRPYTYHGNAGYLISGSDKLGRRISIFARSKSEAERMRDDIKAGRETMFDSER